MKKLMAVLLLVLVNVGAFLLVEAKRRQAEEADHTFWLVSRFGGMSYWTNTAGDTVDIDFSLADKDRGHITLHLTR